MRFVRYLAVLTAVAGVSLASVAPATASSSPSSGAGTAAGVTRIDLGSGAMLPPGAALSEQLAPTCDPGYFCGYGYNPIEGRYHQTNFAGCGVFDIEWDGPGWWVNNLRGSNAVDRVAMFDFYGNKIYTTPHSPFTDTSADWSDVWEIETCV